MNKGFSFELSPATLDCLVNAITTSKNLTDGCRASSSICIRILPFNLKHGVNADKKIIKKEYYKLFNKTIDADNNLMQFFAKDQT